MRKVIAVAMSLALVSAVTAQAHEGHAHKLMGTVKAVHADMNHVELTTADGKTSGFYVNSDTKYVKGSGAVALADLKPGMRVVVDTKMDGDKTVATSVKLAAGTKTTSTAAPAHKH